MAGLLRGHTCLEASINLKINQVVDPKKGVKAVISKDFITLRGLLTRGT